jgi:gamma-glutamylcyclotransferase (GGCT)/AIG2-like uncharacterized protein YtfP
MRFFFYGTLIDASNTPMARWLRPKIRSTRGGTVPGRLFAIPTAQGWYPALVPGTQGQRVRGVCCDAVLTRRDLARLDCYEGREYRRAAARVRTSEGLSAAQLYRWRGVLPPGATPVSSGGFLDWLARRGFEAYGTARR